VGGEAATRRPSRLRLAAALLAVLVAGCASVGGDEELLPPLHDVPPPKEGWTKEQKLLALNAATTAVILAYGFQFWDYGGASFQFIDEGWFGADTSYGGADKIGHAYAAYLAALGFAAAYEAWGYDREEADLYGAISSMAAFTLIEVGDGFSKNGFSFEDLVLDAAGVLFGYARRRNPTLGKFLDFRVEYWPSETVQAGEKSEIATDYSGFKYLLAFKFSGFEKLENHPLGYLELHLGYYTRGFVNGDQEFYDEKTRNVYVGFGINLSHIFNKVGLKGVGKFFNFYQPPYTYIPIDWELP
jgi:hypothetical protein